MPAITFDALKVSWKLKAAGIDAVQAAAVVRTIGEAFGENVATRGDLAEVKADLTAEIAGVRTEIQTVKAEIFRALWIQGVGIVGLIVGLTKLLD